MIHDGGERRMAASSDVPFMLHPSLDGRGRNRSRFRGRVILLYVNPNRPPRRFAMLTPLADLPHQRGR
jgi:hypothetical protein